MLRDIVGYEGTYAARDDGAVFRLVTRKGEPIMRQIRPRQKRGYLIAHLCLKAIRKDRSVHRCVWEAFNGPIEPGFEINHINGDKTDNRLSNLEVVTRSENTLHKFHVLGHRSKGRGLRGSLSGVAKFHEDDIPRIRERAAAGESYKAISEQYGCTPEAIGYIVRRVTWSHVP